MLAYFPGRRSRKRIDKVNSTRNFEGGQQLAAVICNLLDRDGSLLWDNGNLNDLTEDIMRCGESSALFDVLHVGNDLFHLPRKNVFSTNIDHILCTTGDVETAIPVQKSHVSGSEVAVGCEQFAIRLFNVTFSYISAKDCIALDCNFANVIWPQRLAVLIDNS